MRNTALKQRKLGTRPKRSTREEGGTRTLSSKGGQHRRSGGFIMTATSWLILAPLLLFGFIYVDHMTHNSLHRKVSIHQHEMDKIHHDSEGGGVDSGNKEKVSSNGQTSQEAAMHALKTAVYEDPTLVAGDGVRYHLIFSTDCSEFQHWQSYLMFYSALKANQSGTITRIASGWSDEEAMKARQWHQEHISSVMGE